MPKIFTHHPIVIWQIKLLPQAGYFFLNTHPEPLPLKQHFPRRNRIISGLAQGVLIVEGNISSGSMITAQIALDQNREIMAIPGSVYSSNSAGPNNLIKKGATLINNYTDILEALNLKDISTPIKNYIPTNESEKLILEALDSESQDIDEIIRKSGKSTAIIQSTITILELKRVIRRLDNNTIVKAKLTLAKKKAFVICSKTVSYHEKRPNHS